MTTGQRYVRPGILETAGMCLAVFLLAADVPWAWTVVRVQGEIDTGGDAAVSIIFLGLGVAMGLQMNGRWTMALRVLGREPLLLIFLWWATVSAIWSEDLALSVRRVIAMLITSYLGAHLSLRFKQFSVLRIVAGVLVLVAMVNLLWITAFPQYSGPARGQSTIDQFGFDARLTGIYDNANSLGRIMALTVFTCVAALKLDRRRRLLYLAGIGAAGLALALSQSKTSLVISVLTSLLLVIFMVFRSRKQLFGAVVVSVIGSGLVTLVVVVTNLALITTALDRDVTLTGRVPLWESVFPRLLDRPIQGYGFNGYWNGWGSPSHEIWNLNTWRPPHAHNQFIDVMLLLGVIGLLLFVGLQLRTLVRATRYVRDVRGVFGLWPLTYCCFFLLAMLTESGLIARDLTWFLYVAVVVLVSEKKGEVERLKAERVEPHMKVGAAWQP